MSTHKLYCSVALIIFLFFAPSILGQNETKKWYFGNYAALDFTTNPPTPLSNNAMNANYSCSSIADASGNLLFYTNGATVWDKTHNVMANGTGLLGNAGTNSQGSIIIKQPGNTNLYYIFTTSNCWNCTTGFNYSIVDISLASGNGSVTVKNANLFSGTTSGRVSATRHCNGVDIWVVTRDWYYWSNTSNTTFTYTPNFLAYLLTSTGVSTTAVVSAASTFTYSYNYSYYDWGCMKLSPNGKKLGLALYNNYYNWNNTNNSSFEMYDFDNTTGIVSNSLALLTNTTTTWWGGWGCEFSPDGTKFYGSNLYNSTNSGIYQWDLCAGSPSAIVASVYTIATGNYVGSMQLASNGKIYNSNWNSSSLGVIGNPNAAGSACNYTNFAQSVSPGNSTYSLPNFMASNFISRPPPTPFTYTTNNNIYGCQTATFNSLYNPSVTVVGCSSTGYSLTNVLWNFGDPASGSANTSTLQNPSHAFTTLGTYSVQLVLYYSCGGGTDTLKQLVNINQPCITVNSTSITCANLGSATVAATGGIGPYSYTWMPTAQSGSVANGLSPGSYTITVYDFGTNFTYTASTVFTSLIPLTGSINISNSITCNGANTGTGSITNLAGGTGNTNFAWYNGSMTHTVSNPNNLSAGLWTVSAIDAVTGCSISNVFFISQPPPLSLALSANSQTACAGTSIVISGTTSGGTPAGSGPAYSYSWTGGLSANTQTVSHFLPGTFIYTLNSQDSYSCGVSNTIALDFITNPSITVSNASICPLQTGTITLNGATSYTWSNNTTGNTLVDNPLSTTSYSFIGSALGCTASATGSIILKPLPVPILNSNAPICNLQNLNLFGNIVGNSAATYQWVGPLGFNSNNQYPTLLNASPNASGAYQFTVTAANGCTAATSATLTVHPTPSLSASGSTVCVDQTLVLFANSVAGATYSWTGPASFSSNVQNPSLNTPGVNATGVYTVIAASAAGCTNVTTANASVTAMPIPSVVSNSPKCFGENLNFSGAGGDTYQWYGPNGFNSSVQNPMITGVTVPAGGIYTLTITRGPCTNSKTETVTVFPLPSFTPAANSPCETKVLNLSSTSVFNATNYFWQGPVGYNSQAQNPTRDSSTTHYAGIYTLTVLDLNTCVNTQTLEVFVRENPDVTAASTTVCLNQPAVIEGNGAQSYLWSGPDFYQSTLQNALITKASSSVVTVYTLVGTAVNGCTSTTTASLTTESLPTPWLTVSPKQRICLNNEISFEGFGGVVYDWFGPGNFKYSGKVLRYLATSPSYAGTYTLVATDEKGCSNYTLTTLEIDPLPQGNLLGSTMDACVPFKSDFVFTSGGTIGPSIDTYWSMDYNQNTVFNKSGKSFSYTFKDPGEYHIVGSLNDTLTSCKNTIRFVVYAREIPQADYLYNPEHPVENLDEVVFSNNSKGKELSSCHWYFINNGGYTSTQNTASYLFKDAGNYPVAMVVTNKWNCADTVVKSIRVETDFNIYVPNAFTPNEDKKNEVFMPVVRGATHYEFTIYNRWGEQLFLTRELSEGWDGTYNDLPCKNDIYVYKITLTDTKGNRKNYSGHVTLYR